MCKYLRWLNSYMSFQLKCCFSLFLFYSPTISLIPCQTRSSTHWFHHSCVRDCTSLWYSRRLTQLGLKQPIEGLCGFREEGAKRRGEKRQKMIRKRKSVQRACALMSVCVERSVNKKMVPCLGASMLNAPKSRVSWGYPLAHLPVCLPARTAAWALGGVVTRVKHVCSSKQTAVARTLRFWNRNYCLFLLPFFFVQS